MQTLTPTTTFCGLSFVWQLAYIEHDAFEKRSLRWISIELHFCLIFVQNIGEVPYNYLRICSVGTIVRTPWVFTPVQSAPDDPVSFVSLPCPYPGYWNDLEKNTRVRVHDCVQHPNPSSTGLWVLFVPRRRQGGTFHRHVAISSFM